MFNIKFELEEYAGGIKVKKIETDGMQVTNESEELVKSWDGALANVRHSLEFRANKNIQTKRLLEDG